MLADESPAWLTSAMISCIIESLQLKGPNPTAEETKRSTAEEAKLNDREYIAYLETQHLAAEYSELTKQRNEQLQSDCE
jgi:hypothetical protein